MSYIVPFSYIKDVLTRVDSHPARDVQLRIHINGKIFNSQNTQGRRRGSGYAQALLPRVLLTAATVQLFEKVLKLCHIVVPDRM